MGAIQRAPPSGGSGRARRQAGRGVAQARCSDRCREPGAHEGAPFWVATGVRRPRSDREAMPPATPEPRPGGVGARAAAPRGLPRASHRAPPAADSARCQKSEGTVAAAARSRTGGATACHRRIPMRARGLRLTDESSTCCVRPFGDLALGKGRGGRGVERAGAASLSRGRGVGRAGPSAR